MRHRPNKEDIWRATIAGWCWLAAIVIVLLCSCRASGADLASAHELRTAVCRIINQRDAASDIGSGTLIDKTDDGREGLVLTCAHLFRDGSGEILVKFAGGRSHRAKLIDVDHQADLAALAIASPAGEPVEVSLETISQSRLHACGYGPRGIYRCAVGPAVGQAASTGQMSLLVGDAVRSGDSGGGVFDQQGRLVAVIWGEAQGVTYASYGQPLREFLSCVLGRRTSSVVYSCPTGVCPRQPIRPSLPRRENINGRVNGGESRWADFQKQLDELRATKQDRGDYLTRGEMPDLGSYARFEEVHRLENEAAARHAGLLERLRAIDGRAVGKAAGKTAVGLLGLGGPAGWAVVAVASIGGWIVGRRMKRKLRGAGGRRKKRFRT